MSCNFCTKIWRVSANAFCNNFLLFSFFVILSCKAWRAYSTMRWILFYRKSNEFESVVLWKPNCIILSWTSQWLALLYLWNIEVLFSFFFCLYRGLQHAARLLKVTPRNSSGALKFQSRSGYFSFILFHGYWPGVQENKNAIGLNVFR